MSRPFEHYFSNFIIFVTSYSPDAHQERNAEHSLPVVAQVFIIGHVVQGQKGVSQQGVIRAGFVPVDIWDLSL